MLLAVLTLLQSINAQDSKPIVKSNQTKVNVNPKLSVTKQQKGSVGINSRYGTVTDIDGNVYKTVRVGDQIWMAENLKTRHYNDGTSIPNVTDSKAWLNITDGAYCYYNNDNSYNLIYGKLYNWNAVNTGKLAPKGWHVPSVEEWRELIDYLGGSILATNKIKSSNGWEDNGNNTSGFSASPSGYRIYQGDFNNLGANWWCSGELDNYVNTCVLFNIASDIVISITDSREGMSVRCIKD